MIRELSLCLLLVICGVGVMNYTVPADAATPIAGSTSIPQGGMMAWDDTNKVWRAMGLGDVDGSLKVVSSVAAAAARTVEVQVNVFTGAKTVTLTNAADSWLIINSSSSLGCGYSPVSTAAASATATTGITLPAGGQLGADATTKTFYFFSTGEVTIAVIGERSL